MSVNRASYGAQIPAARRPSSVVSSDTVSPCESGYPDCKDTQPSGDGTSNRPGIGELKPKVSCCFTTVGRP